MNLSGKALAAGLLRIYRRLAQSKMKLSDSSSQASSAQVLSLEVEVAATK